MLPLTYVVGSGGFGGSGGSADMDLSKMIGMIIDELMGYEAFRNAVALLFLAGVLVLLYGAAQCFFGYKIFRIICAIVGFAIGFLIGFAICGEDVSNAVRVIVGLLCGVGIGALAFFLYKVGIFLITFILVWAVVAILGFAYLDLEEDAFFVATIPALIVGVLACVFTKPVLIVTSALSGGSTMSTAITFLFLLGGVSVPGALIVILGLVFAGLGIWFQFMFDKKHPGIIGPGPKPKPAPAGAYPPNQPPRPGMYPPPQGNYPPNQPRPGNYPPPQQGNYPTQAARPQQSGYQQSGYRQQNGYSQQGNYPPQQNGYQQQNSGYNSQQQNGSRQ